MANIRKRTVSISTILSATAFRDGYEAASKGIPFDPDAYKGERYHGFSAAVPVRESVDISRRIARRN
jgi:hypothetical protein